MVRYGEGHVPKKGYTVKTRAYFKVLFFEKSFLFFLSRFFFLRRVSSASAKNCYIVFPQIFFQPSNFHGKQKIFLQIMSFAPPLFFRVKTSFHNVGRLPDDINPQPPPPPSQRCGQPFPCLPARITLYFFFFFYCAVSTAQKSPHIRGGKTRFFQTVVFHLFSQQQNKKLLVEVLGCLHSSTKFSKKTKTKQNLCPSGGTGTT